MSVVRSKRAVAASAALITAALAAHDAHAAAAPELFTAPRYRTCVAKIAQGADDALEDALVWRAQSGGLAAEHCAALALLAMRQPAQAAERLDRMARDEAGSPVNRAELFDQAGNAWLFARNGRNAEAAFTAALQLTPRNADVWTDRARARAMLRNWKAAEADLSFALVFAKKPEIYLLRATTRRALNRLKDARRDIDWALYLNPRYADALVERGSLKLIAGDKQGARRDWLQVLLIAPEGSAGDEARRRIEDLEINLNR